MKPMTGIKEVRYEFDVCMKCYKKRDLLVFEVKSTKEVFKVCWRCLIKIFVNF